MKKIYLSLVLALLAISDIEAAELPAGYKSGSQIGVEVEDINIDDRNDIVISMGLDFSKVNLQRNREVVCTPMLVNGEDTLKFTSFSLAGRNRYIYGLRNGQLTPLMFKGFGTGRGELSIQSIAQAPGYSMTPTGDGASKYKFIVCAPYQDWMETSSFSIEAEEMGCSSCKNGVETFDAPLAAIDFRPTNFITEFIYVTPVAETVKTRNLSGSAYVDFKVNKTNILPGYRNNRVELDKIIASIDSVKNNKDITVTSISIKGTASPEGPYNNNVYLAKTRTQSLVDYVTKLYSFPKDFIKTSYEPVDWAGLREWLENHEIENGRAILSIVNGDLEAYARNQKIKTTYPKQYQYLLENVYPSLRHSDYMIEYTVRNYVAEELLENTEEIITVMRSHPERLSLNELYMVAQSQPEGSDLFNEILEVSVNTYPEDETANLNAATAAMMRGDFESAKKYLAKSGDSEEAIFMRAEYEALLGNKSKALEEFKELAYGAKSQEVREKAARAADSLEASMKNKGKKWEAL